MAGAEVAAHPPPEAAPPLAPAHTDWLRHVLAVTGPVAEVARFAAAAAGPGTIPWVLDLDRMEEDWFLPMVAPARGAAAISLAGARILARQLRDATAVAQQRALENGASRRCVLDLHRLLPVPARILQLGPDDPQSHAWLWRHWGTTRALRQVHALPGLHDGRLRQTGRWRAEFWSADWSPWPALLRLRRDWPLLGFDLKPDYAPPEPAEARRKPTRARRG